MHRLWVPLLLAGCLFVLQGTLLSGLELDLLTPVLVYVAFEANLGPAALFALGLGFLCDTMFGAVAGLNVALNLGVLTLARLLRRHLLLRDMLVRVAAVAVCLLARSLLLLALAAVLLGWPPQGATAALAVLIQVAGGSLVSLPVFAGLDWAMEMLALKQQPL